MKVKPVQGVDLPFALHIANKSKILTIVEMGGRKLQMGGIPAVLTDGVHWYSGELIEDPDEVLYVVGAVNMYGSKNTARRDAERRWG